MTSRRLTLSEVVVALALAVILLPALFPPPGAELRAVREAFERETARLIVEGELSRARQAATSNGLRPGVFRLAPERWPSAAGLGGLALRLVVRERSGALLEVAVEASWSAAGVPPREAARTLRLVTLVAAGRDRS